ncbi:hypothetical protein PCE1_002443 [Barthelona sp. PCE]
MVLHFFTKIAHRAELEHIKAITEDVVAMYYFFRSYIEVQLRHVGYTPMDDTLRFVEFDIEGFPAMEPMDLVKTGGSVRSKKHRVFKHDVDDRLTYHNPDSGELKGIVDMYGYIVKTSNKLSLNTIYLVHPFKRNFELVPFDNDTYGIVRTLRTLSHNSGVLSKLPSLLSSYLLQSMCGVSEVAMNMDDLNYIKLVVFHVLDKEDFFSKKTNDKSLFDIDSILMKEFNRCVEKRFKTGDRYTSSASPHTVEHNIDDDDLIQMVDRCVCTCVDLVYKAADAAVYAAEMYSETVPTFYGDGYLVYISNRCNLLYRTLCNLSEYLFVDTRDLCFKFEKSLTELVISYKNNSFDMEQLNEYLRHNIRVVVCTVIESIAIRCSLKKAQILPKVEDVLSEILSVDEENDDELISSIDFAQFIEPLSSFVVNYTYSVEYLRSMYEDFDALYCRFI